MSTHDIRQYKKIPYWAWQYKGNEKGGQWFCSRTTWIQKESKANLVYIMRCPTSERGRER